MMDNFKNSQTKENLMRAFAGESQARNRYTFAASKAKEKGLPVVERVFSFTANQEKEHAEIFYYLLESMAKETIHIDGGYPVDISENVAELLRMAEHNEMEEHDDVYKHFGDVAKQEGFDHIAMIFHSIAAIEKTHGNRFGHYASLMEKDQLFASEEEEEWMCLNCGHIHRGKSAPGKCPVCQHEQGYFIRTRMLNI